MISIFNVQNSRVFTHVYNYFTMITNMPGNNTLLYISYEQLRVHIYLNMQMLNFIFGCLVCQAYNWPGDNTIKMFGITLKTQIQQSLHKKLEVITIEKMK